MAARSLLCSFFASWIEPTAPGSAVPAILRIPEGGSKTRNERIVGLPQAALDILERRRAADPEATCLFSNSTHKRQIRKASRKHASQQ